jgi:hypothetical protein
VLVHAQLDNGNITGRVTDPTGVAIAGAQVTVTWAAPTRWLHVYTRGSTVGPPRTEPAPFSD